MAIITPPHLPYWIARNPQEAMFPHLRDGLLLGYAPCIDPSIYPQDYSDNPYDMRVGSTNMSSMTIGSSPPFVDSPWGKAIIINGSTDVVRWGVAASNTGKFKGTNSGLALSCGFRWNAQTPAGTSWIFCSDPVTGVANIRGWYVFVDEANGFLAIGQSDGSVVGSYYKTENGFLTANTWCHIFVQWGQAYIYTIGPPNFLRDNQHFSTLTFVGTGKPIAHNGNPANVGRNRSTSSILDMAFLFVWGGPFFRDFEERDINLMFSDPFAPLRHVDDDDAEAAFRRMTIGGPTLNRMVGTAVLAG